MKTQGQGQDSGNKKIHPLSCPLLGHRCAVCGCLCYSPEAEPEQTIFWDRASRSVLCSAHSDVAAGTPAHPWLREKWRFNC